jgi:hypothetical protein
MGRHDAREGRREDPEHHQAEAHHADGAVEELAVEAELALEVDRRREDHGERDPDRRQARGHATDDALGLQRGQDHAAHDIGRAAGHEQQDGVFHRHQRVVHRRSVECQRVIGVDLHLARAHADEVEDEVRNEPEREDDNRRQHDRVEDGSKSAGPGKRFHVKPSLMRCGCGGSGRHSRYPKSAVSPEPRRRRRSNRPAAVRYRCWRRPAPASSRSRCS